MRPIATNHVLIGTGLGDRPVQRTNAELAKRLTEIGYKVTLLIHGPNDDDSYVDQNVKVRRWPSVRPTSMADAIFLDRLLRQLKPCCVIAHFGATVLMMGLGAFRRVPVRIRWCHTLSTQNIADRTEQPPIVHWVQLQRARILFKLVTHMVANSQAVKQDVIKTFHVPEKKCHVFWNALRDPLAQTDFPNEFTTQNHHSQHFVCVGRFDPSKGQDIAIKATARAIRHLPGIRLHLVGDGPTQNYCQELARELGVGRSCTFTSRLTHEQVLSRLASARAAIIPSRSEAFGLVNIESMALGVPVIASNTGGIPEIVRDNMDGMLFPVGDDEALGRAMVELAQNDFRHQEFSLSARQRFLDCFELSRSVRLQADWIVNEINKATGTLT